MQIGLNLAIEGPAFELRPYQREAAQAAMSDLACGRNPVIELPTGTGKSVVIGEICRQFLNTSPHARVLVLAHVGELIVQNAAWIERMVGRVGVVSAGHARAEYGRAVTVGTIQTVANRLDRIGEVDLVIIDEAHRVPLADGSQYRTTINEIRRARPAARVVGLSATPYRLDGGSLVGQGIFDRVCYRAELPAMWRDGYLAPLKIMGSAELSRKIDAAKMGTRGGEFRSEDVDAAVRPLAADTAADLALRARDRQSAIVFASGIDHALDLAAQLDAHGRRVACIFGETSREERARIIEGFRSKEIDTLVNVDVLTTGFDAPNVDCVAICRPTMSPSLYIQMLGRGLRLAPGKRDCLLLDYGCNVLRHGEPQHVKPENATEKSARPRGRYCPACGSLCAHAQAKCACGYEWPAEPRAARGPRAPAEIDAIAFDGWAKVELATAHYHVGRDGKRDTLKIAYQVAGLKYPICEWLCVEHPPGSWARKQAEKSWEQIFGCATPETIDACIEHADKAGIKISQIRVKKDGKFHRVIGRRRPL